MRIPLRSLLIAALVCCGTRAAPLSAQPAAQTASVPVDSIRVTGNLRQATPVVLSDLGIRPGDTVTIRNVQRGVQRLYATGEYDDIRVYALEDLTGSVTLLVEVVERPYITAFSFQGLSHVGAGAIRDSVGLRPKSPLSPAKIHRTDREIRKELAAKGFVRAEIDTSLVATDRPGEYRLIFRVDEGRRLVVAGVDLEGNERVKDGEVRSAMKVKPEGFLWWKTGEFREDDYRQDREVNIADYYASRGFLDFRVLGDTLIVNPETGKTKLVIRVEEGPQYRIADFQVEGNSFFPTEFLEARFNPRSRSLLARLPLVGGDGDAGRDPVFNARQWRESTDDVQQLYRNAGFLYAKIDPIVERLPEGEDGEPRVRLKWSIQENEQAYINLVDIRGNTTTHERVIRDRITLLPGDVYADERIVSSYQTVQGLGFFEPLPPDEALDVRPNQEGNINVSLKVKEKQTGNINFGASLSQTTGVAGFIGYEQPNLFGQAKTGRFRWLFGSRTNDVELGYNDPSVLGSRNSFGVSLRSSRDRFSFVGLGRRRQTGGSMVLGTPLFGSRWTRVSLRYSLFRDEYDSNEEELDLEQRELLNIGTRSSAELRLSRDTRNHPLFPTGGSRNSISLEFTGGPLGGDGDYRKLTFESEWYTPIARLRSDPTKTPIDLALGLSVKGGSIQGDNPFFLERFFMGGVQYGPPLRGYEELTITPSGHVPRDMPGFSRLDRVGESYFALYANLGLSLSGSFFINAFYDAGNVWERFSGFNPTDLFRGVGVGVSLITPVGPLGLDYAYGLDARDALGRPDPGWRLHVRFGQIF